MKQQSKRSREHCGRHCKTSYGITYLENGTPCCVTAETFPHNFRAQYHAPVWCLPRHPSWGTTAASSTGACPLHNTQLESASWPNRGHGPFYSLWVTTTLPPANPVSGREATSCNMQSNPATVPLYGKGNGKNYQSVTTIPLWPPLSGKGGQLSIRKAIQATEFQFMEKRNVKVKFFQCLTHSTLHHEDVWGSGCTDPCSPGLSTSWMWVVIITPRPLYPTPPGERAPSTHWIGD
jgi:hypothetical protein